MKIKDIEINKWYRMFQLNGGDSVIGESVLERAHLVKEILCDDDGRMIIYECGHSASQTKELLECAPTFPDSKKCKVCRALGV